MAWEINITVPGPYLIQLRCRRDKDYKCPQTAADDQCNDIYSKVNSGPWEKTMVAAVERAILASDLGLNPNTAGTTIRIVLPPLTEERRRELTKVVGHEGEHAKVAIRNVRRDAIHHLKELLKEKNISEDEERRAETQIQQLTDKYVAEVDEAVRIKDEELMEI